MLISSFRNFGKGLKKMLWGNMITILGLGGVLFSGFGVEINMIGLAVGFATIIVGVIVAFNQIKETGTDKARGMWG